MSDSYVSEEVCAPGVKFLGGSCITIDLLEDMIRIYNNSHSDKMDISNLEKIKQFNPITYKKKIVEIIKDKMKNYKCDTQTCWLSLPFFRHLSDSGKTEKLHRHTFKPTGPKNTNEWLNTYNINDIFVQYEKIYPDFKFMGALPRDFDSIPSLGIKNLDFNKLIQSGKYRLGFIFNLDKHNQSGSHWVALFADLLNGQIYFIDSVGDKPAYEFRILMHRIKTFCETDARRYFCDENNHLLVCKKFSSNKNKIDVKYNKTQHQYGSSECGVYAISFILRLLDGESFDDIANHRVGDEEIKLCRREYFRTDVRIKKSST